MKAHQLKVEVSGGISEGKSVVISLIARALSQYGYHVVQPKHLHGLDLDVDLIRSRADNTEIQMIEIAVDHTAHAMSGTVSTESNSIVMVPTCNLRFADVPHSVDDDLQVKEVLQQLWIEQPPTENNVQEWRAIENVGFHRD